MKLQQAHVIAMEARPPNIEGKNEVTQRDLVRNALRMRPDRIIIGEVRGAEAFDMLQAMNTGHEGSLTTVHANSPRDALIRIENMVLMAGFDLPVRAIREQIASALHLVVQLARFADGKRRVTHVTEITGLEGDTITMQELFVVPSRSGIDEDGQRHRPARADGHRADVHRRVQAERRDAGHGPACPRGCDGRCDPLLAALARRLAVVLFVLSLRAPRRSTARRTCGCSGWSSGPTAPRRGLSWDELRRRGPSSLPLLRDAARGQRVGEAHDASDRAGRAEAARRRVPDRARRCSPLRDLRRRSLPLAAAP